MRSAPRSGAALVILATMLAGCQGGSLELNRRDDLAGSEPLPDLESTPSAPPLARDDAPSLSPGSLDRSGWDRTVVTVATGQVERQPTYTTPWRTDRSTARARGEMPDASNVLEGPGDPGSLAWEGAIQTFQPPASLVTAPAMVFVVPPWSTVRGPVGIALVGPRTGSANGTGVSAWTRATAAPDAPAGKP